MGLSDLSIRALPVPERGQKIHWDGMPGFGIRISQGGTRTFVLVHGPNRQFITIGRHPIITLAQARAKAREILAKKTLGIERPESPIFEKALDLFITRYCQVKNRPRTAAETERLMRKHFLPSLKHFTIDEIPARRISDILDGLLDSPSTARHAFVAIRTFFRWCARRGLVVGSPIALMDAPTSPGSRDRVLTDAELVAVFRTAEEQHFNGGKIVQLLILTGQRRGEIGALKSEWIDRKAKTITFPSEITKNGRTHILPYGEIVAGIVDGLPPQGFLFPARGTDAERSYNGWSKLKKSIDPEIPHWTLHDLRRTFATNLAALAVPPHIIERLLNHSTGTISGVAAIYNRFSYLPEMCDAMQKWEAKLKILLSNTESMNGSDVPGPHHERTRAA